MPGTVAKAGPADPAVVGRVVRPHALAGEVVVVPMASSSAHFEPGSVLWMEARWVTVQRSRQQGDRWIVLLGGIADRDAAEAIRDVELFVDGGSLPELDDDSYYVHDLIGCRVEDPAGADLGTVVAVVPGPHDWLELECAGERSLLPMARDWLQDIDIDARRIVMDAPQGLAEATRSST